jgi:hypothetical protein
MSGSSIEYLSQYCVFQINCALSELNVDTAINLIGTNARLKLKKMNLDYCIENSDDDTFASILMNLEKLRNSLVHAKIEIYLALSFVKNFEFKNPLLIS